MDKAWIAERPRRIAVITGSRADYGHLRHVIRLLSDHPAFVLQVVACGMHLAPQFGSTWREIERDGFHVDARVDLQIAGDSQVAAVKSTGLGMIGFADALERLAPELVIVLGDRYEILAAGAAAVLLGIPIAHLHGGELTFG
ncbi:MAG: UDP-N-acetylglucosamine 2-epimerase, partial [Hyphomicrobium sp.]